MQPSTIRIGVIGYGYWGPNLVRNFAEVRGCRVVAVSDSRPERRALVAAALPGDSHHRPTTTSMIADPNVDAVAIATPVLDALSSWRWRRCGPASTSGREADDHDQRRQARI